MRIRRLGSPASRHTSSRVVPGKLEAGQRSVDRVLQHGAGPAQSLRRRVQVLRLVRIELSVGLVELLLDPGPVRARQVSCRNGSRPRGSCLIDELPDLDDIGLRHPGGTDIEGLEAMPIS